MASYRQETGTDTFFWAVSGESNGADDVAFVNRASPVPDNLTLSRLTIKVITNTTFNVININLVFGPTPTTGNNTVSIPSSTTGTFTDTSNSDVLSSGTDIAYQLNGTGADFITLTGSSCVLRGSS